MWESRRYFADILKVSEQTSTKFIKRTAMSVSVSVALHDGRIIGYSPLKWDDPSMGFLSGLFTPTSNYEPVAHVFQFLTENPYNTLHKNDLWDSHYKLLQEMGLQLLDCQRNQITDVKEIHIDDYSREFLDKDAQELVELVVRIRDGQYWEMYLPR